MPKDNPLHLHGKAQTRFATRQKQERALGARLVITREIDVPPNVDVELTQPAHLLGHQPRTALSRRDPVAGDVSPATARVEPPQRIRLSLQRSKD